MSEFFERVQAALAAKTKDEALDCPSCGQRGWKLGAGELGNLWVLLPLVTEHGDVIDTPTQRGGLTVCPMICNHCGYTRFYTLQALLGDGWGGFGSEGA